MYSKKKCYDCGEIVENCFAHGACPKAVNDPEIRCGHFKHDLYWDIVKGNVFHVLTLLHQIQILGTQIGLSFSIF